MGMMLGNEDSLDCVSHHRGQRRLVVRHIPLMLKLSSTMGRVSHHRGQRRLVVRPALVSLVLARSFVAVDSSNVHCKEISLVLKTYLKKHT
jgi:hypothetical protein